MRPQLMPPAEAGLVSREPVKNARSLLRNALPINDRYIREIQVRFIALPRVNLCVVSLAGVVQFLCHPPSCSLGHTRRTACQPCMHENN